MPAAVANAAREVANDGVATGEEQDGALGHPVALYDDAATGRGLSRDGEVAGVCANGALRMDDPADAEDAGARSGSLHAGTERAGTRVVEIRDFHHDATAATEGCSTAALRAGESRDLARRRRSGCVDGDSSRCGLGVIRVACGSDSIRRCRRRGDVGARRTDAALDCGPGDRRVGDGARPPWRRKSICRRS